MGANVAQTLPSFTADQLFQWALNFGLGAAITLILLGFLAMVIRGLLGTLARQIGDAVTYFTSKLDQISDRQERALDRLIQEIHDTRVANVETSTRTQEALQTVLLFISHTQQEVVAHRTAVEGAVVVAPSPPMRP